MKGAKVRRLYAHQWGGIPELFSSKKLAAQFGKSIGNEEGENIPVAVVDMRKEAFEELVEKAAEEIAVAITGAFVRGQYNAQVVTEKREDYQCARAALSAVFGVTPRRKTRGTG